MIVRGPGIIGAGRVCDTPAIIEDFFSTILRNNFFPQSFSHYCRMLMNI